MTYALFIASRILVAVTVVSTLAAFARRRDAARADIALSIGLLASFLLLGFLPGVIGVVGVLLYAAQPYLTLRLVQHFRTVPLAAVVAAMAGTVVFPSIRFGVEDWTTSNWNTLFDLFRAGLMALAAGFFLAGARAGAGVTRGRLGCAGFGTALFAFNALVAALSGSVTVIAFGAPVVQIFASIGLICYCLAFATPRFLTDPWQQLEQAKYLAEAAERDPEERAAEAARDLNHAAARTVGHTLTFVALERNPGTETLVIEAATDPALVGTAIPRADRLASRVWLTGFADDGGVTDCEPELAPKVARHGTRVLMAPVAAGERRWGVVGAVQTRGWLFPDDDLRLLSQLGRHAATALDHGSLALAARSQARRAAEQRLREAESHMSLMLDSIKDYAMCLLDEEGRVVNWHVGARHVFGYTSAEMDGELAAGLFAISPEALSGLLEEARVLGRVRREGPCLRKDGVRFVGTTTIRPLEGGADAVQGFAVVTRDVTEQRELEARFRQTQKMDAIGQLAGGIAHDFNNLLAAVLAQCGWLELDVPPGHPLRAHVDAIHETAERAAGLTRQLLAFSRRQVPIVAVMNLAVVVGKLEPILRRAVGRQIEFEVELPDRVAPVLGDRSQVEQILLNLVLNSRDAMPRGGCLTTAVRVIELEATTAPGDARSGPFVELEVTDSGVGMDEATQAHMFDPFFTTKPFGRGTGLGLATVHGIVQQMGGFIRVASEPDRGTTFRLFFPRSEAREAVEPTGEEFFESLRGTETILVVEDDAGVRTSLAETLARFGYHVRAAEHHAAASALADAEPDPVDLVITDVVGPGGTGIELAKALATSRPAVPVLYLSPHPDAAAGDVPFPRASHFLPRPFTSADLLVRLRELLHTSD